MLQEKSLVKQSARYTIKLQNYQKQGSAQLSLEEEKAFLTILFDSSHRQNQRSYDLNSFSYFVVEKGKGSVKMTLSGEQLLFKVPDEISLKNLILHFGKFLFQSNFFENYQPIKKLGKGGFSTVYMVKNKTTGEKFAAKTYSKASVDKYKNGKECLLNQIAMMRCCDNKYVLKLIQIYEQQSAYYAVLELVEGEDLHMRIKKSKLSESDIKLVMHQLLKGLKCLHDKKIIHRDLKPSNIFFKNDHHLVIGDFGLATSLTEQKYLIGKCGTPGYAAPQLLNLKQKQGLTPASDIFSVGAILYQMLSGKRLFDGQNVNQILELNRQGIYNLQGIEPIAQDLLIKMLELTPSSRPSIKQILHHDFLSNLSVLSLNQQNIPPSDAVQKKKHSQDLGKLKYSENTN